ncbi:hypothetical protein RF11_16183 [Thelohanellus kitauei]|uniref:MULE transposase domain-containing protein n=1 Tax=Thelohanellus kitauei TaxID=669202 RepID=A0A0C2JYH8_THEKT|nr:hypothetical protein RF11_16183 [Thelohanellus kitauei]
MKHTNAADTAEVSSRLVINTRCHVLEVDMKVQKTLFTMKYRAAAKTRMHLFRTDHHCHIVYSPLVINKTTRLKYLYNYKVLIFPTETPNYYQDNLDLLLRHRHWLADGTFKCLPAVFYKLFTLHVYIEGSVVPAVYALLPNKTRQTYQRMLLEFSKLRQFSPESILTDFELLGLQTDYKEDEFSFFVRILAAIAFAPVDDIVDGFGTLIDAGYPDNFIGQPDKRGYRRSPPFSLTLWNVNQSVLDSWPHTKNSVEGWHRGFQSSLLCSHPSL